MERKLSIYVFIRNSIILCVLFLIVSIIIIEHRKQLRGEESLFGKKSNFESANHSSDRAQLKTQSNYIIY
ncbi:MAG: hypothetical protein JEZ09_06875 [Salinivirgaceae bacterium]|nr:hypothetical protein [Salinivirgaceae bacterium]